MVWVWCGWGVDVVLCSVVLCGVDVALLCGKFPCCVRVCEKYVKVDSSGTKRRTNINIQANTHTHTHTHTHIYIYMYTNTQVPWWF